MQVHRCRATGGLPRRSKKVAKMVLWGVCYPRHSSSSETCQPLAVASSFSELHPAAATLPSSQEAATSP